MFGFLKNLFSKPRTQRIVERSHVKAIDCRVTNLKTKSSHACSMVDISSLGAGLTAAAIIGGFEDEIEIAITGGPTLHGTIVSFDSPVLDPKRPDEKQYRGSVDFAVPIDDVTLESIRGLQKIPA